MGGAAAGGEEEKHRERGRPKTYNVARGVGVRCAGTSFSYCVDDGAVQPCTSSCPEDKQLLRGGAKRCVAKRPIPHLYVLPGGALQCRSSVLRNWDTLSSGCGG
jgi:hypothetical protein